MNIKGHKMGKYYTELCMYEVMEICSRTLQFLCCVFFFIFFKHDHLGKPPLVSACDALSRPPDSSTYVGADALVSVLLHGKLQYSSVKSAHNSENIKSVADTNSLVEQAV